ncbi:Acetyltransferase (GNAT) domain-containing protein [Natronincola peptidivorans]|uniref:Acetyltransferase (GNAT) domain-containing protein n=1 Tax=Natronincola peptidivorans TaxID=426128 RepID=A0A1I0B4G6_9FIRM|nr:GNAT family N-acetyltransferase [Natronincola peptidivorans]SET01760.1 Acetyltransferase (GNAT) domain-containing protein [Natronincola peptidivorans]
MIIARGKTTYITELQREQVDAMQWWGHHTNPLFDSYNFPIMNTVEREYWYRNKKYSFTKRCFGVCNLEDIFIGYIALRNIRWVRKHSELGIVFDPKHVGKGYGSDSLKSFLDYYFHHMKMKQLGLKVALFNKRAEKCYENSGFQLKEMKYDAFEDQNLRVFQEDSLIAYRQFFQQRGKELLCSYKHMYITKEMHLANKTNYPHYTPNTCAYPRENVDNQEIFLKKST